MNESVTIPQGAQHCPSGTLAADQGAGKDLGINNGTHRSALACRFNICRGLFIAVHGIKFIQALPYLVETRQYLALLHLLVA